MLEDITTENIEAKIRENLEDITLNDRTNNVVLKFKDGDNGLAVAMIGFMLGAHYSGKFLQEPYSRLKNPNVGYDKNPKQKKSHPREVTLVLSTDFPRTNSLARPSSNIKHLFLCYFNIRPASGMREGSYEVEFARKKDDFENPKFIPDRELGRKEMQEFLNYARSNYLIAKTAMPHH